LRRVIRRCLAQHHFDTVSDQMVGKFQPVFEIAFPELMSV
jgi:hypothetical protein